MSSNIRIQKLLAALGYGSRRSIENKIKQGEIKLNGKIFELGAIIKVSDFIEINSKTIKVTKSLVEKLSSDIKVIIYNKPEGEVCTRIDDKNRKTVFDNLPKLKSGKWISVGRLDINTSGLLIFTNNGDLANKLMHPKANIDREYLLKTSFVPSAQVIANLKKGVKLEDGFAKFKMIKPKYKKADNKWFYVTITEGRNREVRRLWQSQDIMVSKLIRIGFGKYKLPKDLSKGKFIETPI